MTSYATDPDVEPILITSELSGSITDFANGEPIIAYAEVRQGFSPIINAEVWAKIDRPGNYAPVNVQLLDNGAGKYPRQLVNYHSKQSIYKIQNKNK